ncbi:phage portal protein [Nocardia cyriacigeorgica]|uniref:phage portal protein n=1 Tax=Nocardia cyriacigeorgica TaxID=135487 RepID=UPI0013B9C0DF|nr:phage portal protein [Nocardia cyriacigeorgica]NEW49344.1 phage portal protein [Nocardia cyriacigeorgica]
MTSALTDGLASTELELSDAETKELLELRGQLYRAQRANELKSKYYDGEYQPKQLDIAVPPQLKDLDTVNGWPAVVVDTNAERHGLLGWTTASKTGLLGLDEVFEDNDLGAEQSMTAVESLLTGVGWMQVGRGGKDEPEVLVTAESASSTTAIWDRRKRRARSGLSQTVDEHGRIVSEGFYFGNVSITLERDSFGRLRVANRDQHNLDRVPIIRFPNYSRPSDTRGRSAITRAVRYLTDAALRTLLGMEINREFYTAPQRAALGADPEMFGIEEDMTPEEIRRAGWSATMGRLNILPFDEDGHVPQMHQFAPAPPTPYIEQIRAYALMLSTATAIPAASLGVHTDNPASSDAIAREETRLIKQAEHRNRQWTRDMMELAHVVLLWRDARPVDRAVLREISVDWMNPATPTRASDADYTSKLVAAKVLPPDSPVTYKRLGMSRAEIDQVTEDKRRGGMSDLIARLPVGGGQGVTTAAPVAQ